MKAMIFAAGLGTRLKPITDNMPKAMVPICGKTLLYHVIQKLKSFGYDEFVVNVHHFPEQIISYLADNDNFGLDIKISDERELLRETGGGLAFAEPLLNGSKNFLVHNVDILSNLDLNWLKAQVPSDSIASLVVSYRETSRYLLFNEDMRLVGWTNISTGEVKTPFENLDVEACHKYAFAGIHYISDSIFEVFKKEKVKDRFSIIDFYLSICKEYPIYGIVPKDLVLVDVGKLNTISIAENFIQEGLNQ